jgi:hypothetical protein
VRVDHVVAELELDELDLGDERFELLDLLFGCLRNGVLLYWGARPAAGERAPI